MRNPWRGRQLTKNALVGAVVAAVIAMIVHQWLFPPHSISTELSDAAFEREVAVAEGIGLTVEDSRRMDTEGPMLTVPVSVQAGSCVAVVVSASGAIQVGSLALHEGEARLAQDDDVRGLVAHAQYCVSRATELTLRVVLEQQRFVLWRHLFTQGEVRYAVLFGRPRGGLASLNRGLITSEGSAAVGEPELLRAAEEWAADRTPIGPPLRIPSFSARLVPETADSYIVLQDLALNRHSRNRPLRPDIVRLPADAPPSWRQLPDDVVAAAPGPDSVPAMAFRDGAPVRVLAVVDAAALGRCIDVRLVRLAWTLPTAARRHSAHRVPNREENFMTDRVCAERAVFVTDGTDHSVYALRLYEAPEPEAGPVEAVEPPSD